MPMKDIYLWYDNTVKQIPQMATPDGIAFIKLFHNIEVFDMVFIDGSPFTAMGELHEVYGSDIIVLDDTIDLKCWDVMQSLLGDTNYKLLSRNDGFRNGYAVFKLDA